MQGVSTMELMLNPEKYGYVECKHCNGYGTSLKEDAPKCTVCGGLGLVKKLVMKRSPSDDAFWSDVYKTIQQKIKKEG